MIQETYLVKPPSPQIRQQLWADTYIYYLNSLSHGPAFARDYADKILEHFDKLFTEKKPI